MVSLSDGYLRSGKLCIYSKNYAILILLFRHYVVLFKAFFTVANLKC